jgi:hypothetical protein
MALESGNRTKEPVYHLMKASLSNGELFEIVGMGNGPGGSDHITFQGNGFKFDLLYHPEQGFAVVNARSKDPTFAAFGFVSKIPNISKYILTHRMLSDPSNLGLDKENLFGIVIAGSPHPMLIGHISSTYMLVPREEGKPSGPKQSVPITTEYLILYKQHASVLTYQRGIGYGVSNRYRDSPSI